MSVIPYTKEFDDLWLSKYARKAFSSILVVMYQKVTIVTQPSKIFKTIIPSILVYVMDCQDPRILIPAQVAYLGDACPFYYSSVHEFSGFKVLVIFPNIQLVAPSRLATFIAKELTTF